MKMNFLNLVAGTFYINILSFLEVSGAFGNFFLGPSVPWIILNNACPPPKKKYINGKGAALVILVFLSFLEIAVLRS